MSPRNQIQSHPKAVIGLRPHTHHPHGSEQEALSLPGWRRPRGGGSASWPGADGDNLALLMFQTSETQGDFMGFKFVPHTLTPSTKASPSLLLFLMQA